jgi:DNA-binding MarR family transcriptional regulator
MENIGKLNAAIYRSLQSILNFKLKDMPIQSGQHDFFYVISKNEGITQKELGEHLHVGKSTTAKAVKNLIAHGYIRKEKDDIDKRFERLYLTEEGKEIVPRIQATFIELVDITTKNMPKNEIENTIALLKKILENVDNEKAEMNSELEN